MRWIVTLLCALSLLGARGGRAEDLRLRPRADAQLDPANPALVPHVAPRRGHARPDLRGAPAIVPTAPSLDEPPRLAVVAATPNVTHVADAPVPVPSSRGPPRG